MPSRAYSIAATFASWITAALVAQYGAACDQAVSPDTDAVRMIEPDCCARMTGTAARMPLTAPSAALFFHGSASGESNHPGATTLTVMPAGARSRASAFARPTSPAFDAL